MKEFYFFTDGASEPTNPGPSAYAFVELPSFHHNDELYSFSNYIGHSTNNIAELKAIDAVFNHILNHKDKYLDNSSNVIYIYSDSQYALDCIRKWYKQWISKNKLADKKNLDIIGPAYSKYLSIKKTCNIKLEWVKGHNNHWGNERADYLCSQAIKRGTTSSDDLQTTLFNDPISKSTIQYDSLREKAIALDKELKLTISEIIRLHKSIYNETITDEEILYK